MPARHLITDGNLPFDRIDATDPPADGFVGVFDAAHGVVEAGTVELSDGFGVFARSNDNHFLSTCDGTRFEAADGGGGCFLCGD